MARHYPSITFDVWDADMRQWKPVTRNGKKYRLDTDVDIDLFPIRVLAEAIGRTPQTIVIWEREGLFPGPVYNVQNHRCKRWYSRGQILGVAGAMRRLDCKRGKYFDKDGFLKEVRDNFVNYDLEEATA